MGICSYSPFFSQHIRVAAYSYHSNLSIIFDIFRKKSNAFNINLFHMVKTLANLRQFVNIICRIAMRATLDEI